MKKATLTLTLILAVELLGSSCQAQPPRKPAGPANIILILADDFGYECVGANGGTSYKTPNLDKLAAGGMRFDRCFVQPLCTPTRVQLMTGLYNVRNYIRFGLLDPKATTFANVLKRAGYATAMTGKWQLGGSFDQPKHFGFDEYCLWQLNRRPHRYANPGLEINGKSIDYKNGEYGPDLVNAYALDFITRSRDRPFFLYYPMMLTHDPWQPTPDSPDWNPRAMDVKSDPKYFADNTAYMDKLVGKVVTRLDELKLREKTLILFLGDNGTGKGITSQMGPITVKGAKGSTVSAGMHVPLIASWPGTIPAGKVCKDLVDSTDFLPTMCDAAGAKVPAEPKLDGHSFFPQLRGDKGTPREWIYCWYSQNGGARAEKEFAANERFKLYRSGKLFDYAADVDEKKALVDGKLSAPAAAAQRQLQAVLDRFKDARPDNLAKEAKPKKKP